MISRLLLASVAFLVLAGCGGGSTSAPGGGPGSGTGASVDQAVTDAAEAYCTRLQACAPAYATYGFGALATCEARFKMQLVADLGVPGTSETVAQVEACAQVLGPMSCPDLLGRKMPSACLPQPGTLADGVACLADGQCKGTRCRVPTDALCGACTSPAAAGAACDTDGDCQPAMACVGRACTPYGTAGSTCSATQPCRPDLGCAGGTCGTPSAAGTACQASTECDQLHGVFCNPVSKQCQTVAFAPAGGACGLVSGNLVVCTGPGSFCSGATRAPYAGTCTAFATDGASCDADAGPLCDFGAACVGGTCEVPGPTGCR